MNISLPALRFLESPSRRLLIADEVGLGKTIEAGLILLELAARGHADRVLIVVPPHLRAKWQAELRRRFDIDAAIWHGRDVDIELDRVRGYPAAIRDEVVAIVSQHAMSMSTSLDVDDTDLRPSRTELMAEVGISWDAVIVDEAHHGRNAATRQHRAFADLGRITDALIFLTATPLNLGNEDLFNLLRILRPDRFSDFEAFGQQIEPARFVTEAVRGLRSKDAARVQVALEKIEASDVGASLSLTPEFKSAMANLKSDPGLESARTVSLIERSAKGLHPLSGVFTRTRKRDLPQPFARREARQVQVHWTTEEWEFYDALRHYVVTRRMTSPFALVMPSRQAASCIPAMIERLRENNWITSLEDWRGDAAESEEALEIPPSVTEPAVGSAARLQSATESVVGVDTKFDVFLNAMKDLKAGEVRQILVFSFFRKTLQYLQRRLSHEGFRVRMISGDVPLDRRSDLIDQFRRGEFDVLLSSEVGSEGLDFEFASCLVNYDLPWNPMVVEQRIGRLDRFGQLHEKIIILNLQIPGTIETDIVERLYERIGVFRESIGDLDEIVGDFIESELIKKLGTLTLSTEEREELARQLEEAIEKQRLVAEELESHKDVLAASADLLEEQFSSIRRGGRYVDPSEIKRLVQAAVSTWYPDARWEELGSIHELSLPMDALTDGPLAPAFSSKELMGLGNKINFGSKLRLTFDYAAASRDIGATFLTARHPLVKAIASLVTRYGPPQPFRGDICLSNEGVLAGEYECRIFEAHVQSLSERVELIPIAFDGEGNRASEIEEVLLGDLAREVPGSWAGTDMGLEAEFDQAVDLVRRELVEHEEVRFEVDQAQRREVIMASHEAKIASLERVVTETRGTKVEAANRARLNAVRQRQVAQLRDLHKKTNPTVHFRHVASLRIKVDHDQAGGSDVFKVPVPAAGQNEVSSDETVRRRLKTRSNLEHSESTPKSQEFVCARCFLTRRIGLRARTDPDICYDCASG